MLYTGVGLDVLGRGIHQFPVGLRNEIVAQYPRKRSKQDFVEAYFAGFAHKPATTYGTVNASICEHFLPGFRSPSAYDLITNSPFPDRE